MLNCQRDLFSLSEEVVYLNCAYMAPQLKCVEAAGRHALSQKNEPYRVSVQDFFSPVQRLKATFARLINASDPERVALLPSVSYGMATVARNLPVQAGQRLVITADQFPSNYYAWERLAAERGAELHVVSAPTHGDRTTGWNEAILAAIDERTALVAMGHVHWADGTLFDLVAIRRRSREVGAWMVIDGTQSVGALPFDVHKIQPDALVCAGYKWLMGPYAITLAYFGPALDNGIPLEENWINRLHSDDFKGLVNYQPAYRPAANRYCMGEHSNFLLVPMMQAALDQLLAWGIEHIQAYCQHIGAATLARLQDMGVQLAPASTRAHHLVGLRLGAGFDEDILQQELVAKRILVSQRGDAIRIAPNVYNQTADFLKLAGALEKARKGTFVAQ